MKIRVLCVISYIKDELWDEYPNMIECILTWNYPALPREQETIDDIGCLFSDEVRKILLTKYIGEFFVDEYLDSLKFAKEDRIKVSVLELLSDLTYKIDLISWQLGEDGIIPCIQISPKAK